MSPLLEEWSLFDWRIALPIVGITAAPLLWYLLVYAIHLPMSVRYTAALMLCFLVLLIFSVRYTLHIDEKGIAYRYAPIHFRMQRVLWEDIEKAYCRIHHPPSEFGGWGPQTKGPQKAYTMPGPYGIDIQLKNGKSLLLSVKNPQHADSLFRYYLNF